MRAIGSTPRRSAASAEASTRAAAPSEICELLPAVTVPSRGRPASGRRASPATSRGSPSSRSRSTPSSATRWSSKAPSFQACAARWWLRTAKASWSSRLIWCFSTRISVASPRLTVQLGFMRGLTIRQPSVVECMVASAAGKARSGPSTTCGARVIDSTPPATMTSASPIAICRHESITASRPLAHRRLTVRPGMDVGRPASSTAIRATLRLSSPDWLAAPRTTSSMMSGSKDARSTTDRTVAAARSSGRTCASAPP